MKYQKSKNEIIEYVNSCGKKFIEMVDEQNRPIVFFVKDTLVLNGDLLFRLDEKIINQISTINSSRLAFVAWENLEGYQLKGVFKIHITENKQELILETKKIYDISPGNKKSVLY